MRTARPTESDKSTDKIVMCFVLCAHVLSLSLSSQSSSSIHFDPHAHASCTKSSILHISMQTYFVCLHSTDSPRVFVDASVCDWTHMALCAVSLLIPFHAFYAPNWLGSMCPCSRHVSLVCVWWWNTSHTKPTHSVDVYKCIHNFKCANKPLMEKSLRQKIICTTSIMHKNEWKESEREIIG